jgi:hypothetical protein
LRLHTEMHGLAPNEIQTDSLVKLEERYV